jgi:hypothetical protein
VKTGASTSFSAAISAGADSAWLELQSAWRLKTSRMNDSSAIFWATEMVWVNSVSGAEGWLCRAAAEAATATADKGEHGKQQRGKVETYTLANIQSGTQCMILLLQ